MSLTSGTAFGNYQIGKVIGEGGMGQVFQATDTSLDREVAVKVLPDSFARDADRIARFEREAKTLASLNHPNIAQIYGLEKQGEEGGESTVAIVMELVPGPTLADRIAQGPIPAEEALRIAKQIVDGLEAAHDRGIVHRDLKPANIKIREDGSVKILDFGIAKPIDMMATTSGHSPTMVTPAVTESGVIMGTAAYMSPEQARGKFVDQRTDIWAFGCVLYEMLTGQPAFGGEDVMITLARILDRDADLGSISGMVMPAVSHTIKLCLRKDPKKRIGHISDVRLALAGEFESELLSGSGAKLPVWKKVVPMVATAVLTALVAVPLTLMFSGEEQPTDEREAGAIRRSALSLPPGQSLNFPILPAISLAADSSRMVYGANGGLFLRDMDELEARPVPGTENENVLVPAFSPDGRWIAYANGTDGGIKRVSVEGGTPLPILPTVPSNGYNWETSDTLLYGNENEIWRVTANGGSPELLATDEAGFDMIEPRPIPGSDLILFERRTPDRANSEVSVAGPNGEITRLFPGNQPNFLEGFIIYFDPTLGLLARTFDPDTLAVGSPVVMVDDILRVDRTGGGAQFRISDSGSLLYVKGEVNAGGGLTMMVGNESDILRNLDVPPGNYQNPSVSPDGTQVAVENGTQIWVYRLDGSNEIRQLTREGNNWTPAWTPDGEWITYGSDRDGTSRIWRQRADGRGVAEALTSGTQEGMQWGPAWTPDGRLAYIAPNEGGGNDIWVVAIPVGEPELLVSGRDNQEAIAFSPDGTAMAYQSNENSLSEVLVAPYPPDGSRTRVSAPALASGWPVWSREGNGLYYQVAAAGGQFEAVDLSSRGFAVTNRRSLPYVGIPTARRLDTIPGTNELLLTIPDQQGSGGASTDLIFVENWIEEIRQRVPRN